MPGPTSSRLPPKGNDMTYVTLAAIALAANLAAAPEKGGAAAQAPADAAPATAKSAAPAGEKPAAAKPAKASKEAIKDAIQSLLGPCSPEMADTAVKAVSVIGGKAMNAVLDAKKSKALRADPAALFLVVEYDTANGPDKDYRQVSTQYHLTTAQAQVLVGEKMCVLGKAP